MDDTLRDNFQDAALALKLLSKGAPILFILRHAESQGQKQQSLYKTLGDKNIPLTEHGLQQARSAGHILSSLIDRAGLQEVQLISSTGHRSTRTAVEIFNNLRIKPHIDFDPRLDKQKFGDFDGLFTSDERRRECPETYPAFQKVKEARGLFYARPPNGESIEDVQNRMKPFLKEQIARGGCTIVITHGTNALCLEDLMLGRGVKWIMDRIDTRPNCAIRMINQHSPHSYTAQTICTDPIAMLASMNEGTPLHDNIPKP